MKNFLKVFLVVILSFVILFPVNTSAYNLTSAYIRSTITFVPKAGFGDTTIQQFNDALYKWNSASGITLMKRSTATSTALLPVSEKADGQSTIFRYSTGSNDYVAKNYIRINFNLHYVEESDININMFHSFANSAKPQTYDIFSVFLHEAGHTAGLDENWTMPGTVMYYDADKNLEKRTLSTDDINGITAKY